MARAALLLFSLSVPIDALALPGVGAAVMGAGFALLLAGIYAVVRTRVWRPIPPPLLWLTAYTLWTAVTLLWAHDLRTSWERVFTNLTLLVSVWLAWQIARTRADVRAALAGFVIGCLGVSLGAWRSFFTGLTQVEMKYGAGMNFDEARYVALGFDPNDMALTLAFSILIAGYLGLAGSGRWRRLWLAYLPLALSAIVLSGSRGSAVAAAFAVAVVLWWMWRQDARAFFLTVALLVVGGAAVWMETPETWERIFTVRQQLAGGTLGDRLPIWRAGWDLFLENPLLGVGVGGFPAAVSAGLGFSMVSHNTPLSVAAESGLVGLLLFSGTLGSIAWGSARSARPDRRLVLGLLATWIIGTAVNLMGRDDSTAENP
jgi:O-antigen ligase